MIDSITRVVCDEFKADVALGAVQTIAFPNTDAQNSFATSNRAMLHLSVRRYWWNFITDGEQEAHVIQPNFVTYGHFVNRTRNPFDGNDPKQSTQILPSAIVI